VRGGLQLPPLGTTATNSPIVRAPGDFIYIYIYIYYQQRMGFHPVEVTQYNTQGTPTNHKEHITQINTLLSN
jgi:hypothetical protein